MFSDPGQHGERFTHLFGFVEEVIRAQSMRGFPIHVAGAVRQHNSGWWTFSTVDRDSFENVVPGTALEHDVDRDHVRMQRGDFAERLRRRVRVPHDASARRLDQFGQKLDDDRRIFDHVDGRIRRVMGGPHAVVVDIVHGLITGALTWERCR